MQHASRSLAPRARRLGAALFAAGLLTSAACAEEPLEPLAVDQDEIIGGIDAKARKWDAVGTVGTVDEFGYYFFCTATLIDPDTVLTAKHCAMATGGAFAGMKYVDMMPMYFAVGPEAHAPARLVEAIAADVAELHEGGFVELGADVAVYHLVEPITDIEPVPIAEAELGAADLGKKFISIGYGSKDNYEDVFGFWYAPRKTGTATMRALEGPSFQLMYGGRFDKFINELRLIFGGAFVSSILADLQLWWDNTYLLAGHEAWVGDAPGDAQTCHGDSGGPLLRKTVEADGVARTRIFGVVSGGWFTPSLMCGKGTFYSTMGSSARELLARAAEYSDPCAGGIDTLGYCDGDTAIRCTGKWEGERRLSVTDCSELDLVCGTGEIGQVACLDPETGEGGESPVDPSLVAPTPGETRALIHGSAAGKARVRGLAP